MSAEGLAVLLALLSGLVGGGPGSQMATERLRGLGLGAGHAGDRARGPAGSPDDLAGVSRIGARGHDSAGHDTGGRDPGGGLHGRGTRWSGRSVAAGAVLLGLSGHGGAAVASGVFAFALLAPAASARRRLRARHLALSRDVPRAADLMATCLEAGASPAAALGVVADVIDGPLAEVFRSAAATLAFGGPIDGRCPDRLGPAAPLLAAFGRAASTGAPLASTLRDIAADGRDRARGLALERARKAGVHAIGPLAVCFLPAFVLVGVVPVVVGVARTLLIGLS